MNFCIKRPRPEKKVLAELFLVMKLTVVLLVASMIQVSANGFAQRLTYSQKNTTLKQVFNEIRKQTGYDVVWPQGSIKSSTRIDADFKETSLEVVLNSCFAGKPLEYSIEDKTIVVKEKQRGLADQIITFFARIDVQGRVVDDKGQPLIGATVVVKGHRKVVTDVNGNFQLANVDEYAEITVSYIGYISKKVKASSGTLLVQLQLSDSKLDEVQVIAYGEVSRRLNTGNVTTVKGEEIYKAPISNVLATLEGRVPGMIVNQTSGVPGSAVKVQIRGRTNIDPLNSADDSPLYIIDGVPMAVGNANLNTLSSAISGGGVYVGGGLSPFSSINAGDVESIEVLKDADATAIYGSRGASGVILITTKKGKKGATKVNIRALSGFSKAQLPDLLTTKEYVTMRKEALANDKITMNNTNAYDLLLWDTTRNQEVAKALIGGSSSYTNAQATISGGTEVVTFSLGGSVNRESNVYADPTPNDRGNAHMSLSTTSLNKKFTANFRGTYAYNINRAPGTDLSARLTLLPHYKLYNEDGSLAWNEGGIQSDNPLALLAVKYEAKSTNINTNILLSYSITPELMVTSSLGYNTTRVDELSIRPRASYNPLSTTTPLANFGGSEFSSWIAEPQLEYRKNIGKGKLNALAGATIQSQKSDRHSFTIRDYSSDDFLGTFLGITSTSFINATSSDSEYKYAALFGRVTYNLNDTYIINLSGRRDGSSRFGPNFRYSTFGAMGAAWIFSNEKLVSDLTEGVLSFGKLRMSFGNTGNDKIGDYKFIDLYGSASVYNDSLSLTPTSLYRADLHWEQNKKLEFGLELGFLKDRILVSASWYRNRSNDPLVQFPLPGSTGFSTVVANLNGVVLQNKGLEFSVDSKNIQYKSFEWRTSFNITFPENKLLAYPDLESSPYSNYILGRSLDLSYTSNFKGVDPQTGLYTVEDLNGNGVFNLANKGGDLSPKFETEPHFYGGLQNSFKYRGIQVSVFMNFNKQWTQNWRTIPGGVPLGALSATRGMGNLPGYVMRRWQKPGDVTDVQMFSTRAQPANSLSGSGAANSSDAKWENIFYGRLRTLEISYSLPQLISKKIGASNASFFVQGQNLFTFSPFRGTDPQTVFLNRLAPLSTYVAGAQFTF